MSWRRPRAEAQLTRRDEDGFLYIMYASENTFGELGFEELSE